MRTATRTTKCIGFLATLGSCAALFSASAAPALAAPQWGIDSLSNTTAQPGDILDYRVEALNVGDEAANGEAVVITTTLPEGLTVADPSTVSATSNPHYSPLNFLVYASFTENLCTRSDGVTPLSGGESEVRCEDHAPTPARNSDGVQFFHLPVLVDPVKATPGEILTAHFEVQGGGAPTAASTEDPVRISTSLPDFGVDAFDMQTRDGKGQPFLKAGGHPADMVTDLDFNTVSSPFKGGGPGAPAAPVKDVVLDLPPGLVGSTVGVAECTSSELSNSIGLTPQPLCPPASQIGTFILRLNGGGAFKNSVGPFPIFNMEPPPGVPARFGLNVLGTVAVVDAELRIDGEYALSAAAHGIVEALPLAGVSSTLWGRPAASSHDAERACPGNDSPAEGGPTCSGGTDVAFLRMPTSCTSGHGMQFPVSLDSWDGSKDSASVTSHALPGYPTALQERGPEVELGSCDEVPVKGKLSALPTALDTETASGLSVRAEVPNPGIGNPDGTSSSDIEGVKVTLPQGVTLNPSQAEGLGVCSSARYESTELSFHPDGQHGCPSDSKVGTVSVKTPLLEEAVPGDVFVAKPYDNPFNALLAIYIVIEEPEHGILAKLPGELRLNEKTGRIEAEFSDLPQIPFSSFDFKFREGARAPLVTPPTCGTYETEAVFTPWSDPSHTITSTSSFQIVHGIGGGPCPPGGVPSFKPGFSAGSINNNAGAYSPFNMRITRNDGEQDMTRFSAVLPPGVLGKLAGVGKCPDSAIAAAKARTGAHGGQEEIEHPSCPANSEIGHSIVGAGVGSVLTYVPGKVYLGGPFHGDPLSVVAITPVVAGPFDVGTVVVREALTLNPVTAEVEVDGSASDPIPHILKGIPAKLRDLRVYVDRSEFTLNPTSCDPSATDATLFGGGGNAFSTLDDVPVSLSDRFQAASCASLGFKPRLALNLKGGTRRGGHPGLTALYTPRQGDANIKGLTVRLPRSAFLDQAHIKTICTRVQFAAKSCPKGAQYGYIKAWTPLIEEPLQGPVYLRSSNHKLPDLVFDLHGLVDIEVAVRIDSEKGGIRASLESAPDAPLSKVVLKMQGAKKGLIINSRNLCGVPSKANASFVGHNGKEASANPVMRAECGGKRKHKRHRG